MRLVIQYIILKTLKYQRICFFKGIWCLLLLPLVRKKCERWQRPATGLLWHRRNLLVLIVSRACQVPMGGNRGRQGSGSQFRAVYGGRFQDDHHRWRVCLCHCVLSSKYSKLWFNFREGQAIWMDENIRFGKTDSCKTFNNPPLCPSGDFEIRVLEVYGFVGI